MKNDLESILASLISIPSVNPMGRVVNPQLDFESRLTDFLERYFRELGVSFLRQTIARGRDNIVAWLPAGKDDSDAPTILWEVHQDTVPVDGMSIPPFDPAVRDGRMYGRGACDVKGSMAAMLHALGRLANERPANAASVVLACAVDEEAGGSGARGLMTQWPELVATSGLPAMPALSIVAEPTELDVVVAHKGVVRWRCRTVGRAVHSSSPENGDNAIYRMGRVVAALERYHREELRGREPHRLLGTPSLSVGLISGGASVNVVPDSCAIEIDRRVLPGEDCQAAYQHVVDYLARQLGEDAAGGNIAHEPPYHASGGLSDENNGQLAARLGDSARRFGGSGKSIGVPFGTDASHICAAGVPTVVFGPGSIAQAHTADEWIALDQLHAASEILFDFASGW